VINEFSRPVFCLLGLPFDAVNLFQAVEWVRQAIRDDARFFLSTPNLNFLIASQSDTEFRQSVINSELSIVDGMPLVWMAKLLGYPVDERVAGSDLFQSIQDIEDPTRLLRAFFFGGPEGVAAKACERLNQKNSSIRCAGSYSPGFGTIEEMSTPEIIDQINKSEADFLLVALGAKKGQAWIEHNRQKFHQPVFSHLGAVVNFEAGVVKRSPVSFQKIGLEWIWRILQEPKLWSRYAIDGLGFLHMLLTRILPYILWRRVHKKKLKVVDPVTFEVEKSKKAILIKLNGACLVQNISRLRKLFNKVSVADKTIILQMKEVTVIDGCFLGLCLVLYKYQCKKKRSLKFVGLNKDVKRIFYWSCAEYLL